MVVALLVPHIVAGSTALVCGLVALCSRKGSPLHRRFGGIYYRAMAVVAATAAILAPLVHSVFLFLVMVLSFYAAFAGYRVLRRKNPFKTRPGAIDWAAAVAVTFSGGAMIVLGTTKPAFADPAFSPMFVVFGALSMLLGVGDFVRYIRPAQKKGAWIVLHAGKMIGSYIAALTAFSAVNLQVLPLLVRWFWPTLVLVPVIIYFRATESRKITAAGN
ncbi:MAG: hypothetical protein ABI431_02895 [Candidatus Tumulicola sp.]